MNEIDLIKEVEKRPILYDKSVSGFNKTKLRDDAWKEVQESLNVLGEIGSSVTEGSCPQPRNESGPWSYKESECKKRWRSLRDSFIKLQRTHGGRTRWPYHQHMKFLLPHLDTKETANIKKSVGDSDNEEDTSQRSLQDVARQDSKNDDYDDDDSQPLLKKARQTSTDKEPKPSKCIHSDPDELFLISCAPTLKRLKEKQNAYARIRIQQVLLEAEFGSEIDQAFVTPEGDCVFELNV